MTLSDASLPRISVLIRSMNRAVLQNALDSLAAQSFSNFDVVIVNASGAPHDAITHAALDVRLVEPGRSLPRAQAANAALQAAEAPLALFLDDDDLIDPGHLARLVSALSDHPRAPAAYAGVRLVGEDDEQVSQLDEPWLPGHLLVRNILPIHAVLFRTAVVHERGCRFDESFEQLEDWDFWLQLAQAGDFLHCPGSSATYRLTLGQSGLSAERDLQRFATARQALYAKWLPQADIRTLGQAIAYLGDRLEQAEWDTRQLHASEARLHQRDHERQGQLLELREHYTALQKLHAELHQAHGGVWEQYHQLENHSGELTQQHQELQRQYQQLESHRGELAQQHHELQQHQHQVEQQRQALQAQLEDLLNSRSWRVTAPLRWLGDQLRRVRQPSQPVSEPVLPVARSHRKAPQGPVDIIVPVYKGLEETRDCLESVWMSNPATPYRLVVINDASPEPEVTEWLREAARSRPMTLLENEENLGFVGTVNRGMAFSDNADVVLLNSDAEVANDWLDRLVNAAYAPGERPVSTVTPFSNNATICSYPRFCEDNQLPPGYDLARLDRLFAETNRGQTVDIPTAIGFCMYIRRDSLDHVGLFDEEHFGKGYGEENDFCMRSLKAGWRHVHALDVFSWHKGSVSFGDSQPERVTKALQVLHELHPDYEGRVHQFLHADPARHARQAVDIARLRQSPLPRILLINHQRGGGTERHCLELRDTLAGQVEWLMLRPGQAGQARLEYYREDEALTLDYLLPDAFDDLVDLLKSLGVARVHVHHWLGLGDHVMQLAAALGVPQDVTLHDYYAVCPQITLTGKAHRYCGETNSEHCSCVQGQPADDGSSITAWRERHAKWLLASDRVIAPSQDAAQRFERYIPGLKVLAVPHPDHEAHAYPPPRWQGRADEPLRVAILGAISIIKGADVIEAVAAEAARRNLNIEFRLFGYAYRSLETLPTLSVTGPYQEEELPQLLGDWQPHVVWFPALWPETYSYTLSTCLKHGLPVVSTDLGAIPERLQDRSLSWVLDWRSTPAQWCDWFVELPRRVETTEKAPVSGGKIAQPGFYSKEYLAPLQPAPSPESLPPLPDEWQQHLAQPPGTATRTRLVMVEALYWLRRHPLLRGVAKRVPVSLQRRAKSWLLKES